MARTLILVALIAAACEHSSNLSSKNKVTPTALATPANAWEECASGTLWACEVVLFIARPDQASELEQQMCARGLHPAFCEKERHQRHCQAGLLRYCDVPGETGDMPWLEQQCRDQRNPLLCVAWSGSLSMVGENGAAPPEVEQLAQSVVAEHVAAGSKAALILKADATGAQTQSILVDLCLGGEWTVCSEAGLEYHDRFLNGLRRVRGTGAATSTSDAAE